MRTEEAKWLFRWALPKHEIGKVTNRGLRHTRADTLLINMNYQTARSIPGQFFIFCCSDFLSTLYA